MDVAYIYAVEQRIWADKADSWMFSQPQCEHVHAREIFDLGLDETQKICLVLLPEGILPVDSESIGLRQMLMECQERDYVILARAAQVITWDTDHRFCSRCGSQLSHHEQDLAKHCDSCGLTHYPRISPCIITLVTKGDYCLLAHGVRFPEPRYSTLAGFIEAGESAEDALIREVKEEVGVDVTNIRYFRSQSWPFPHSFMLGYFAEYTGGDIKPEPSEIVDAKWFHYSEVEQAPIPPKFTIARQLIDQFILERQR